MDNLIDDLLIQILLRLPVIALLRFKCVCKSWYSIITSSSFIDKHFLLNHNNNSHRYVLINSYNITSEPNLANVHVLRYDTLHGVGVGLATDLIVETPRFSLSPYPLIDNVIANIKVEGSCNGLLLVSVVDGFEIIIEWLIWNPATGEAKVLPTSLYDSQQSENPTSINGIGFGFDAENNDYKVVFIHQFTEGYENDMEMEVYSLKGDTWRLMPGLLLLLDYYYASSGALTNNNGMYSWLMENERDDKGEFFHRKALGEIVSFEMSSEVIIRTCLPDDIANSIDYDNYPMVYDSSLAIASRIMIGGEEYEIWVLREFGVQESWSKLFRIVPIQDNIRCLGFWKDDHDHDHLFVEINMHNARRESKLCLHDHLAQQTLDLPVVGRFLRVRYYQESLVSIKNVLIISN